MRCCVIPCGQKDAGSSQKHFWPFRVLLNVGIDLKFPHTKNFFFFFGFIQRELSLSGKKKIRLGKGEMSESKRGGSKDLPLRYTAGSLQI